MNTHLVLYQPGFPRHRTGNSLVVQLLRLGATVAIIYCWRLEGVLGGFWFAIHIRSQSKLGSYVSKWTWQQQSTWTGWGEGSQVGKVKTSLLPSLFFFLASGGSLCLDSVFPPVTWSRKSFTSVLCASSFCWVQIQLGWQPRVTSYRNQNTVNLHPMPTCWLSVTLDEELDFYSFWFSCL